MALINIKRPVSESHPTRYYSRKQEKALAEKVNGKTTANSGATKFQKGDLLDEHILYECKTKTKNSESILIKKEWLEKNKRESLFMGKDYSVLVFNFGPDQSNYYVLDDDLFMEFLSYINKKN